MTIVRIPMPQGVPAFSQRVMLERVAYVFDFHWNDRAARWFFELRDSTLELITSRPVLPNWPLLSTLVHSKRPPGELIALDTQALGTPIGLNDWGERVVLDYLEASDVADMLSEP